MTRIAAAALACLATVFALDAAAQETASSGLQASDADPAEPLSPVEQWRADPTRIFDATEIPLEAFVWQARPLVVFADSDVDPNFRRQMELLERRLEDLAVRDVIIVTDTDPDGESDARQRLRPRGFMLALISKDGQVALRKPLPWSVREITRSIDKMPIRQQEIEDRRGQ